MCMTEQKEPKITYYKRLKSDLRPRCGKRSKSSDCIKPVMIARNFTEIIKEKIQIK